MIGNRLLTKCSQTAEYSHCGLTQSPPARLAAQGGDESQGTGFIQSEETVMTRIMRFLREEQGVTAIEYGLIAALIAVVCLTVWASIGTDLNTMFGKVDAKLK
jgi:pilus assembly protein Flp/PilA